MKVRMQEWRVWNKKGRGHRLSSCVCCFDLCISDSMPLATCTFLQLWLSQILFLSIPASDFLFLVKTHTLVNVPSQVICQQLGEGVGPFSQSFCSSEKTVCRGAARRKPDYRTFFRAWPIKQTSLMLISFAPPVLNSAGFPWFSICLHVS